MKNEDEVDDGDSMAAYGEGDTGTFFSFAKFWKIRNDFILQHNQHHYHLQNHLPLDSHTLFPNIIFVPFFFAYNLYIPFYAIE